MARRRDDTVVEGQLLSGPGMEADDPDMEETFSEWRESLETSKVPGTLRVFRVPMDEKNAPLITAKGQAELFSCAVDQMDLPQVVDRVRREFIRPGQTAIAIRIIGTQKGMTGVRFNQIIVVEKANESASPSEPQRENLADLLRVIQESTAAAAERQDRLIQAMLARQTAAPQKDPIEIATSLMAAMAGMMGMINGNRPVAPLAAAAVDPMAQIGSTIGIVKQLADLSKSFAPGGKGDDDDGDNDDGSDLVKIIKEVGPVVKSGIDAYRENLQRAPVRRTATPGIARPPASLPQQPAAPVTTPIPNAAVSTAHNPIDLEKEMLAEIKQYVGQLVEWAEAKAPAADVAATILEFVPEKYDEQLARFLERPQFFFNTLKLMDARLLPHQVWIEELRVAILKEFSGDEETPAEGGNDELPG